MYYDFRVDEENKRGLRIYYKKAAWRRIDNSGESENEKGIYKGYRDL